MRMVRRTVRAHTGKRQLKIVVTADCHIHPYKLCSHNNGADRLRDGLGVLNWSLQLAERESAVWVMAGDFKQPKTNWPQEALTGAHEILRRYPDVTKIMVAGNHDAYGLGGSGLAPFRDVASIVEGEAEQVGDLLCVPFGADLKAVKPNNNNLPIIAHAFIKGAFIGPEDFRLPGKGVDLADYGQFPVAFFGDIHKAQVRHASDPLRGRMAYWQPIESAGTIRTKGPWRGEVYYPGSPYMQNWGERNDRVKGVLLVDLKTGIVQMMKSPNASAPRYVQIEMTEPEALPSDLHAAQGNNFVRVLTPSAKWTQKAIDTKGLTFRWLQIIERRPEVKTAVRTQVHAAMSHEEMIREYMRLRPLPPEVTQDMVLLAAERLWSQE